MKKRIIVIVCIVCLIIALIFVSPYFLIRLHKGYIQSQLDNAIIDSGFKDWYTVQLNENYSIKIPNGWRLQIDENLSLYDDTGKQVAFGKQFDGSTSREITGQFLSNYYNDALISCEAGDMLLIPDTDHDWVDLNCYFESGKGKRLLKVICRFYLKGYQDNSYILYFEEPTDELHEIATAMLYSVKTVLCHFRFVGNQNPFLY